VAEKTQEPIKKAPTDFSLFLQLVRQWICNRQWDYRYPGQFSKDKKTRQGRLDDRYSCGVIIPVISRVPHPWKRNALTRFCRVQLARGPEFSAACNTVWARLASPMILLYQVPLEKKFPNFWSFLAVWHAIKAARARSVGKPPPLNAWVGILTGGGTKAMLTVPCLVPLGITCHTQLTSLSAW